MLQIDYKKAVLAVDIGNTNAVCALFYEDRIIGSGRLQSNTAFTEDEYYSYLKSLFSDFSLAEIENVIIASVVPDLTRIWKLLFAKYSSAQLTVLDGYSPLGLKYHVNDPGFIGADLIANAFSVWKSFGKNAIILDLGTATTIQFVSASGVYEGVAIAPGLKSGASCLAEKTALLSRTEIINPPGLLGVNTRDAMLSGLVIGHCLMLEGFIQKIKEKYSPEQEVITVATGGIFTLIKEHLPLVDIYNPDLTMEGLYLAFKKLSQTEEAD